MTDNFLDGLFLIAFFVGSVCAVLSIVGGCVYFLNALYQRHLLRSYLAAVARQRSVPMATKIKQPRDSIDWRG